MSNSSCDSQQHLPPVIHFPLSLPPSLPRKELVYPRRNPSRKARPLASNNDPEVFRRVTRSLTKSQSEGLVEGLEDDQEVKKVVYRTM